MLEYSCYGTTIRRKIKKKNNLACRQYSQKVLGLRRNQRMKEKNRQQKQHKKKMIKNNNKNENTNRNPKPVYQVVKKH